MKMGLPGLSAPTPHHPSEVPPSLPESPLNAPPPCLGLCLLSFSPPNTFPLSVSPPSLLSSGVALFCPQASPRIEDKWGWAGHSDSTGPERSSGSQRGGGGDACSLRGGDTCSPPLPAVEVGQGRGADGVTAPKPQATPRLHSGLPRRAQLPAALLIKECGRGAFELPAQ